VIVVLLNAKRRIAMSKGNDKKAKAGNAAPKVGVSSYKATLATSKLEIGPKKPIASQIGRKGT
jgi:hypothetical protein